MGGQRQAVAVAVAFARQNLVEVSWILGVPLSPGSCLHLTLSSQVLHLRFKIVKNFVNSLNFYEIYFVQIVFS